MIYSMGAYIRILGDPEDKILRKIARRLASEEWVDDIRLIDPSKLMRINKREISKALFNYSLGYLDARGFGNQADKAFNGLVSRLNSLAPANFSEHAELLEFYQQQTKAYLDQWLIYNTQHENIFPRRTD
jgi:hypothetical protein